MSKNLPKVILICIAAILFTGILYFGLRPKGFESSNQVNWLENKNGIRVGRYNTCYADNLLQESNGNLKIPREFTIQIALKSQSTSKDGFQCIMVFHDGSDAEQLLVGQWQSSIVIMNGDDYDNKKRTPKMYIKEGIPSGTK